MNSCDTILVQLVCITVILTDKTWVIQVSHFDHLAARAAHQLQSVSALVVRCHSIYLNVPVCALQLWMALIDLILICFPNRKQSPLATL